MTGLNTQGQLGTNDLTNRQMATKVVGDWTKGTITAVAGGLNHTVILAGAGPPQDAWE
jgi:alpha-tubulin suppressor-like RCC1 family protein